MRRRDLLRGLFVVAVACPAIGSSLARANPRPKPRPKPRPHSQLHPVAPRMIMPPDGLPLVEYRQVGNTIEIRVSNPHERPIAFNLTSTLIVTGSTVLVTTRTHNWSPDGTYLWSSRFVCAQNSIAGVLMMEGDAAETVRIIRDPSCGDDVCATFHGLYHLGGFEKWVRFCG